MSRKCSVCTHKHRKDIDKMLVAGVTYRTITDTFAIKRSSLIRHKKQHIPELLIKAKQAEEVADANDLVSELKAYRKRVLRLFDACDQWLRDPLDPDRYDIGPRAEEINVIYSEINSKGKEVMRKAPLALLLEKTKKNVISWESKHADPRDLILKTADRLNKHLELLAELTGELDKSIHVSIETSPEWVQLRTAILQILDPYPDIRQKMVQTFKETLVNVNN